MTLFGYANILTFTAVGLGFVALSLVIGRLVRPHVPTPEKAVPYECGEPPVGPGWISYNIRYYMLAIIFVIFDVEIAFIFPVAVVFRDWIAQGHGWLALAEILVFVGILLFGLAYVWVKGDLEWIKKVGSGEGTP